MTNDIYDKCNLAISNFHKELESKEYQACRFNLNNKHFICRTAKITPKKVGQFVTFWKRKKSRPIEPFEAIDIFDFFTVNVNSGHKRGQFVFTKSILIKKGIVTEIKEGKRAFRVYPSWDIPQNKTAANSQIWQLDYFFEINAATDFALVKSLYQ